MQEAVATQDFQRESVETAPLTSASSYRDDVERSVPLAPPCIALLRTIILRVASATILHGASPS